MQIQDLSCLSPIYECYEFTKLSNICANSWSLAVLTMQLYSTRCIQIWMDVAIATSHMIRASLQHHMLALKSPCRPCHPTLQQNREACCGWFYSFSAPPKNLPSSLLFGQWTFASPSHFLRSWPYQHLFASIFCSMRRKITMIGHADPSWSF